MKPSIYLWLQSKYQLLEEENLINKKKAKTFLRVYKLPKLLWNQILDEMEEMELIKNVDKFNISLINIKANPFKKSGIEYVRFKKYKKK